MTIDRRTVLGAVAVCAASGVAARSAAAEATTVSLRQPDGRTTDYRVMLPQSPGRWRVILFSHGANASNRDYDRLWDPWTARGYAVIGPNHIDSGPPATQIKMDPAGLWNARVDDAARPLRDRAPFDAIAAKAGGALDWSGVCAAGHSFGAVVAQALAGAKISAPGRNDPTRLRLPAVAACITLSPPGPLKGFVPADAWSAVAAPAFLQTGDVDVLPGFVDDWRLRLTGFAGAPNRYTLIGKGVDHYFHGLICRLAPGGDANLPALEETARLTGDFMDAYLRRDAGALRRLKARAASEDDGIATFSAV
jgi:hypothetical protein